MAHYALITRGEDKGVWKACALLIAGSPQAAARQARALRLAGGLAFVPSPSRFRIRRASRSEVSLLLAFFRGMGMPWEEMASQADIDSGFARRERLLRAFFLGLYLDPEGLRRKYGVLPAPLGAPGAPPSGGSGGEEQSGGGLVLGKDPLETLTETDVLAQPVTLSEDESPYAPGVADVLGEGEDAPLGSDNQENALDAILQSAEANDGGHGREQSFDLDIL